MKPRSAHAHQRRERRRGLALGAGAGYVYRLRVRQALGRQRRAAERGFSNLGAAAKLSGDWEKTLHYR